MQTPIDNLRWDDLRVLLALARDGSLKQAATHLSVNVSTVGRRLDALEEAVGIHLFDRTPEGTRPTAAAEALVPFAESMEQAVVGLQQALEGFEVEPEGEVRLTAPPGLVDHFLAPRLHELATRHPKLRLQILSSIGYADLTRREADLALRAIRPAAGDFVATKLVSHGTIIVASTAMARSVGRLRDPDEVRWITWGEDLAHLPDSRWVTQHVATEQVILRTSHMSAQIEAVRSGLGVMLAPVPYGDLRGLAALPCAPKLRASLAEIPQASLWLVGHRALRHVPRIDAVWTWLRSLFA